MQHLQPAELSSVDVRSSRADEKKGGEAMEDLPHNFEGDMRRFRRRAYVETIDLSVMTPAVKERTAFRLKGRIVDLSDGGIGIHVDYPLEPGAMLSFTSGDSNKYGVVKWAIKVDDKLHKAGLALCTDDTYGVQYPVELADKRSTINEDLEVYAAALNANTDTYIEALEALSIECSAPGADAGKIMEDIRSLNEKMLSACAEFEEAVAHDEDILKDQRQVFQKKTDRILSGSYLMRHARTWPQGGQGDYKMLENVYKNSPLSSGLGYYLDLYGFSLPLAEAVRCRIKKLEEIVRQEIRLRKAASVLNIGCGSCRELMGLAPDIAAYGAKVTCIDMDGDALAFAMERLSFTGAEESIDFRKYNATRMFDDELNMAAFGMMDIIYSAGLFDYLPSEFLSKLLGALYRMLNYGGTLVAPFKDATRYRHQFFHWLVNWDGFRQRTETEFRSILADAGIPVSAVREERDETGIIIFYMITKH
jgi:extracellular factor (EF) 3-hydroxypalmitic acid methyl ester biosynthesis protein